MTNYSTKGEYYEPVKQAGIFVSAVYLKCNRLETAIYSNSEFLLQCLF